MQYVNDNYLDNEDFPNSKTEKIEFNFIKKLIKKIKIS